MQTSRPYAAIERVLLHKHRILGLCNGHEDSRCTYNTARKLCKENHSGMDMVIHHALHLSALELASGTTLAGS
jgi:hypothetical protein